MDAIYGCDGCRTTLGRAGCATHRDKPQPAVGANLFITNCIHGLDLRLYPRCYLCRPVPAPEPPARLLAAAQVVCEAFPKTEPLTPRARALEDLRAAVTLQGPEA